MDGDSVLLSPEGTVCDIVLGFTGAVFQDCNNHGEVVKTPLKYDVEDAASKLSNPPGTEGISRIMYHLLGMYLPNSPQGPYHHEHLTITERCL